MLMGVITCCNWEGIVAERESIYKLHKTLFAVQNKLCSYCS